MFKKELFYIFINTDKARLSKSDIQSAINKCIQYGYELWENQWEKIDENSYKIGMLGIRFIYDIEDDELGYKISAYQFTSILRIFIVDTFFSLDYANRLKFEHYITEAKRSVSLREGNNFKKREFDLSE